MKRFQQAFGGLLLAASAVIGLGVIPAHAERPRLAGTMRAASERSEGSSDATELRPPDPHKELRQLSKDLKLKRDQRVGVGSILQECAREIQLLLDVESLSQEHRTVLAEKVLQDSNAQIATLLKNNQKRKFSRELARGHEAL